MVQFAWSTGEGGCSARIRNAASSFEAITSSLVSSTVKSFAALGGIVARKIDKQCLAMDDGKCVGMCRNAKWGGH